MRLKLQNVGIIENADITIDGITLIAGQNDTGKSTFGKITYSIIKGFNQDQNLFREERNSMLSFYYQDVLRELKKNWNIDISNFQTNNISEDWFLSINEIIVRDSLPDEIKEPLLKKIESLKRVFNKKYNSIDQKEDEIERWLRSEFKIFNNLFIKDKKSVIEVEDLEGNVVVDIWYNDPTFYYVELSSNIEIYLKEAYYIENPLILDDTLQRFVGNENYQIFTRNRQEELAKTLSNSIQNSNIDYQEIYKSITEIINGDITVDLLEGVSYKKSGQEISIKNTALGIKSFGIIQLLLKNNRLNNRSLLIIDEPEIHLHPKWQVKYAEILVLLSKIFEIPILLTSHSPYFIEAIEAFVKKYKFTNSTNFYFAKRSKDGLTSNLIDVTNDISPILTSISDAYFKIQDINDED